MAGKLPDPHEGHGGSYVLDPKTGARELRERTDLPGDDAALDEPKE